MIRLSNIVWREIGLGSRAPLQWSATPGIILAVKRQSIKLNDQTFHRFSNLHLCTAKYKRSLHRKKRGEDICFQHGCGRKKAYLEQNVFQSFVNVSLIVNEDRSIQPCVYTNRREKSREIGPDQSTKS
jgi:hypothetical protein